MSISRFFIIIMMFLFMAIPVLYAQVQDTPNNADLKKIEEVQNPKDSTVQPSAPVAEVKKPASSQAKKVQSAKRTQQVKASAPVVTRKAAQSEQAKRAGDLNSILISVSKKVIPSVVSIKAIRFSDSDLLDMRNNSSFPENRPVQKVKVQVIGSGVIVDTRGNIVTNNHVILDADLITVVLWDGREYSCDLVGADPASDIAVIKIGLNVPVDLVPIEFTDSDAVQTGQLAVAVGSPLGLANSVTMGIVSAVGRTGTGVSEIGDFIQTDASLNAGSSGGALVDLDGKCIGINAAVASGSTTTGIGFSIPSKMVKSVSARIMKEGFIARAWTGMFVQNINPDVAVRMKLPRNKAVIVVDVTKSSPAAQAGISTGDVILSADGHPVNSVRDLQNIIMDKRPGDMITLTVFSGGKQSEKIIYSGKYLPAAGIDISRKSGYSLGLSVSDPDEELSLTYSIYDRTGVVIVRLEPDLPAEKSGLMVGDLVKEMDGKPVDDAAAFSRIAEELRDRGKVLFLIKRANIQKFVTVYIR
jgi:serine protease Do